MGFSKQEYWSGLPFPSPGDLPNPGIEPRSPALQADSLPTELQGKPQVKVKVTQSYLTLFDTMDYTFHGILQARILEWVSFSFSWWSSQPRDWTQVSRIAGGFFTNWVCCLPPAVGVLLQDLLLRTPKIPYPINCWCLCLSLGSVFFCFLFFFFFFLALRLDSNMACSLEQYSLRAF